MFEKKISVIIPIYRVEEFLSACVDRVLNQTYQNIEVILVDDGSPDNCPLICDNYALHDSRVKVIHKKNSGLSDARNAGIEMITGDYVIFIDSDDYWNSENVLKELMEVASNTDADVINFGNSKFIYDKQQVLDWLPDTRHDCKIQSIDEMTQYHAYVSSACLKLIKSDIVKRNPRFESGILSEDIVWSANILLLSEKYVSIKKPYYCYRQRSDSISKTLKAKSCVDLVHAINSCMKIAEQAPEDKKIPIYRYTAYQLGTFVIVQAIAEKCPDECISDMSAVSWVLKYHEKNIKMVILSVIVKLIGFRNTCRFIRLFKGMC